MAARSLKGSFFKGSKERGNDDEEIKAREQTWPSKGGENEKGWTFLRGKRVSLFSVSCFLFSVLQMST